MNEYDVVYPAKGRARLDGGLNTKFERSIIPDNESPSCQNVAFSNGAAGTRGGSTKLNTTAVGSFVGDGLYTRHDNGGVAETMIAFAGGTAWALGGTSTFTAIASGTSVFTAGQRVGAAEFQNHLFIGNGGVTPYKWNGTAFTRHGVPAPTTTMAVAASATGGTFTATNVIYKVTFVNSASVEGNASPTTATLTVGANGSVELSAIPVAPQSHGVSSRRVYRALEGAPSTFLRIATIADNTTTTLSDTCLPTGAAMPTDNGEPPKYNAICSSQGRLFMNDTANPNYIWYTEALEPFTVGALNFLPVGDLSFDLVRGLAPHANGVIIQAAAGLYLLHMPTSDPNDWGVIRLRSPYGSKSPYGSFLYNNNLMVPAMQSGKFVGFAAVGSGSLDPEVTELDAGRAGSDLKSDRVEPDMFDVQEGYVGNISAMAFNNRAYITLTHGDAQTTNNRVYLYDFSIGNLAKKQEASWALLSGLNAAQFTVYDGKLYYISSTATGFVYQLEATAYADDGGAIDSYFWTKEFSGLPEHTNLQKDFRSVSLLVEKAGAYMMNLTYRTDSDRGAGTTIQVDLDPGASVWNAFLWGATDATWGGGTDQEEKTIKLGQVSGKRIQFKVSNQNAAGQRFKVHGLNFNYNVKGRR